MQTVDELDLVQKSNARNRAYYGSSAAVNMTQSGAAVPKKETVEAIMKLHEGFPAKPESKQVYKTEALDRLAAVRTKTERFYDPRVAPDAAADLRTEEGREARASYLCRQILKHATELDTKADLVARDPDQPRKRVSKVNPVVDGFIDGCDLLELENSLREVELLQDTRTSISSFATALPRRVTNFMIDFTTRLALGFN